MQFLVSDYFGTGEGRTVCILVTKAYPTQEDYSVKSSFEDGVFQPGQLANTEKFRAAREFIEQFGSFYAQGAKNVTKEEFFEKYNRYLPTFLERIVNEGAGNINYSMKLHLNFS